MSQLIETVSLSDACALNPSVSIRPEPFGALLYNFDNRRLSFLRSPDIVTVVQSLTGQKLCDALTEAGINENRWPSFVTAINTLIESEMVNVVCSSSH